MATYHRYVTFALRATMRDETEARETAMWLRCFGYVPQQSGRILRFSATDWIAEGWGMLGAVNVIDDACGDRIGEAAMSRLFGADVITHTVGVVDGASVPERYQARAGAQGRY